ncbi:MAG: insulinase family protein [Ignavibacteriales bacterium]|nr:MAG: insulinase family protein [Ignavibacteriales bacterium]
MSGKMKKQQINRTHRPLPTGEIEFTLPVINEFKSENDLKFFFVRKNKLPLVQFLFVINAGSVYDLPGKQGTANLTAMMLDEGAGGLDALQLSDEVDMLGSHLSIRIDEDNIFISMQTLKENLEKSFELLSKVLTKPHLEEKDFKREQRKVLTRIIQRKDSPDEVADSIFDYNLYGKDNPYAQIHLGNEKTAASITIDDIRNYYKTFFNPASSSLIVVGDSTEEEIKNLLDQYLKEWGKRKTDLPVIPEPKRKGSRIIICHKENAKQSEIRIGHLSTKRSEGNFFARHLLNTVLGGQFSSRINLNLREDKGYTYGAFSRFNYFRHQAHLSVSTSVSTENTGSAVDEILYELKKIREGITPEELDFAKFSVIRKFPANFETYSQVASNLSGRVIFSLPENYFNTYIDNIRNVTLDEVNLTALKEILTEEALIGIVGDKNKIAGQLKNFPNSIIINVDEEGNEIPAGD